MSTKSQRLLTGTVVSAKMAKTVVVQVDRTILHEKYGKRSVASQKYHVHDERGTAKVGDLVEFAECRPLSATKRWRFVRTLKTAAPAEATA